MHNVLTIAGKECRVYLTTWTSYAVFAGFLLISAFFFTAIIERYQQISIEYMQSQAAWMLEKMDLTDMVMGNLLRNISIFLLFLLPMLTMRLFAEERRAKTLELLMTTPVRPVEIVLGKYLAALVMLAVMLTLTLFFPLLLHLFGGAQGGASPLDWNTVLAGYLGLFLLGASFTSVGLFASSVTDSQAVAAVTAFAALMLLLIVGYVAEGGQGSWSTLLSYLSITTHLEDYLRGVLQLHSVVYYLSLSFVGLFLTYRVVEAERWR